MILTLQDRIRIPWFSGAKKLSLDAILPAALVPTVLYTAALNIYCTIIICILVPIFLAYTYIYLKRIVPRTKFFFGWAIWSMIYLLILFESTVPLLEILPEENYILIALISISIYCLYIAKNRETNNYVSVAHNQQQQNHLINPLNKEDHTTLLIQNDSNLDEFVDEENLNKNHYLHSGGGNTNIICERCRKYIPARTFHCTKCQTCILRRDHHNIWLDCCIGQSNHRLFFFGCIIGWFTLVFGSNLALTSICHPFLVTDIFGIYVFLPDDCGEVYEQYDVSLCFIGSIYAIIISVGILLVLIKQLFFISKGITATEWRLGEQINRRNILWNWKTFCCYNCSPLS